MNEGFRKAVETEICDTAINSSYCGLLHIIALSSVVGMPIQMIYPDQNFRFISLFHATYNPRSNLHVTDRTLQILWSSTTEWEPGKLFRANHFVPVVDKPRALTLVSNKIKIPESNTNRQTTCF